MAGKSARAGVVNVIDKPLGFYVLALLIVEAFIATVAGLARFTGEDLFYSILLGVGMFFYITLSVTLIVWFKPHVLTFDRDAHFRERNAQPYGSETKQVASLDQLPLPVPATPEKAP